MRWDVPNQRPGLYDHGYCFALPGHYLNDTTFLRWRHAQGGAHLDEREIEALERLLGDPELLGMRDILLPERAGALESRARRMQETTELLVPGDF